eukprot:Rhum_TRINITY_DN20767_c0_g1::Rhum_TRINITY_DN20767_c0_g1_i1::g.172076::m.172076
MIPGSPQSHRKSHEWLSRVQTRVNSCDVRRNARCLKDIGKAIHQRLTFRHRISDKGVHDRHAKGVLLLSNRRSEVIRAKRRHLQHSLDNARDDQLSERRQVIFSVARGGKEDLRLLCRKLLTHTLQVPQPHVLPAQHLRHSVAERLTHRRLLHDPLRRQPLCPLRPRRVQRVVVHRNGTEHFLVVDLRAPSVHLAPGIQGQLRVEVHLPVLRLHALCDQVCVPRRPLLLPDDPVLELILQQRVDPRKQAAQVVHALRAFAHKLIQQLRLLQLRLPRGVADRTRVGCHRAHVPAALLVEGRERVTRLCRVVRQQTHRLLRPGARPRLGDVRAACPVEEHVGSVGRVDENAARGRQHRVHVDAEVLQPLDQLAAQSVRLLGGKVLAQDDAELGGHPHACARARGLRGQVRDDGQQGFRLGVGLADVVRVLRQDGVHECGDLVVLVLHELHHDKRPAPPQLHCQVCSKAGGVGAGHVVQKLEDGDETGGRRRHGLAEELDDGRLQVSEGRGVVATRACSKFGEVRVLGRGAGNGTLCVGIVVLVMRLQRRPQHVV